MVCDSESVLRRQWTRREVCKSAAAFVVTIEQLTGATAQANQLHLGTPAPTAILRTFDGSTISSADLLGHTVLLTFWATWCSPCRDELPLLSRYAAQHDSAGLRVLGFCLDSPDESTEAAQVAGTLSFPNGLMAHSSAPGYGRIWRLPVSFLIDRSGRLVYDGWKDKKPSWTADHLEQIVTPLLKD